MLWQPTRGLLQPNQRWFRPGAVVAAWTPANLPSLIGWWKADANVYNDAGSTLATNGQTVQQWSDQSGVGNHLVQATSGERPTFNTNQLNGLPGIACGGWLNQLTLSLGGTTASCYVVAKHTTGGNGRIVTFAATGGPDYDGDTDAIFFYLPSDTTVTGFRNGAKSNGTVATGTPYVLGSIFDGTNHTMYINGTAQSAVGSTGTFGSTGGLGVGDSPDSPPSTASGGSPMNGMVFEIVLTTAAIGSTDRTNLATYFNGRWGV